jgi:hypothetical protein
VPRGSELTRLRKLLLKLADALVGQSISRLRIDEGQAASDGGEVAVHVRSKLIDRGGGWFIFGSGPHENSPRRPTAHCCQQSS